MNTTSKPLYLYLVIATFALTACLQGPWSYYPEDPPTHRGLFVAGYMVASRPVDHVCVERLLELEETMVQSFAFYDSARVRIYGDFGNGLDTLQLVPRPLRPNCFEDTTGAIVQTNRDYTLNALFWWDSSGNSVLTALSAVAEVPTQVRVTGARAPAPALGGDALANPQVLEALIAAFGDTVISLISSPDSAAIAGFYMNNQEQISNVLRTTVIPYNPDTDTVFYLAPPFDLMSHQFFTDYSQDVRGILVTNIFDTTGSRGETSFDYIFGLKPDSANYPAVGNTHRLLFLQDVVLPSGRNAMDTVPVVNVWLTIGRDTLLFYGVDYAYQRYLLTAVSEGQNAKIKKEYNISGGQGIFSGMVVDTVVMRTQAPPGLVSYPYARTRILACRSEGWASSPQCRAALPQFCADSSWASGECAADAVRAGWLLYGDGDYLIDSLSLDTASAWDGLPLDSARNQGTRSACRINDFADAPLGTDVCTTPRRECLESEALNDCKKELWRWCEDRDWDFETYPSCGSALVSSARLRGDISPIIEREARRWCQTNSSEPQCRF